MKLKLKDDYIVLKEEGSMHVAHVARLLRIIDLIVEVDLKEDDSIQLENIPIRRYEDHEAYDSLTSVTIYGGGPLSVGCFEFDKKALKKIRKLIKEANK